MARYCTSRLFLDQYAAFSHGCDSTVLLLFQVEDIMQTLKLAFDAAFVMSAKTHLCELCPMHQLQKVCEEIHSWFSS